MLRGQGYDLIVSFKKLFARRNFSRFAYFSKRHKIIWFGIFILCIILFSGPYLVANYLNHLPPSIKQNAQTVALPSNTPAPSQTNISPTTGSSKTITPAQLRLISSPTPTIHPPNPPIMDITYPWENQNVVFNQSNAASTPLCIIDNYLRGDNTGLQWKYNLNDAGWTSYSVRQPCIYPQQNTNTILLQYKNGFGDESPVITRHFTFQGPPFLPTATPAPPGPPVMSITYPIEGQTITMNNQQTFCVVDSPVVNTQGLQKKENINNQGWTSYRDPYTTCYSPLEGQNTLQFQYKNGSGAESQIYIINFSFRRE